MCVGRVGLALTNRHVYFLAMAVINFCEHRLQDFQRTFPRRLAFLLGSRIPGLESPELNLICPLCAQARLLFRAETNEIHK